MNALSHIKSQETNQKGLSGLGVQHGWDTTSIDTNFYSEAEQGNADLKDLHLVVKIILNRNLLTYLLTYSLTHSLTYLLTYILTHSLT